MRFEHDHTRKGTKRLDFTKIHVPIHVPACIKYNLSIESEPIQIGSEVGLHFEAAEIMFKTLIPMSRT